MWSVIARNVFRLHERLLGRQTFARLGHLQRSQWWTRSQIEAIQLWRLQAMVAGAYDHSVYWRKRMDDLRISPQDTRSLDDIRRFPLMVKDDIRLHREDMVWKKEGPRIRLTRTSGSTNDGLDFYTSSNRESYVSAARMRGHQWVGVHPGDVEVYFWGAPVELTAHDRLKQVRDWLTNTPLTYSIALTPEMIPKYVATWARWRAKCIFSYVCSLALFARMARRQGVDLAVLRRRGLKALVTTAEMLTPADRSFISEAFGVPVYDSYGVREAGLIGHECSHFTMHTNDELILLETVDPHTLEPTQGEGELVVTNLCSHVMPIIRYRTRDIVTLSNEPCACGRSLRSIRVTGGRMHEFIVTRDGRWISCVAFLYVCKAIHGVDELQARQDTLGEVRVLVVPGRDFPRDGAKRVAEAVRQRLGNGGDRVLVELVESIPRAPSGKQRPVISKVAEDMIARNQFAVSR